MCYYITIAVCDDDSDLIQQGIPRGFAISPVVNRTVQASLPLGYKMFLLTSGGCSCGLYCNKTAAQARSSDTDHLRRKYTTKGWSQAKINRAIEQSLAHQSRPDQSPGFHPDVSAIFRDIKSRVTHLAVLVHWYSGNVEDEKIDIGSPQRTVISKIDSIVPDEDRLLWIDAA